MTKQKLGKIVHFSAYTVLAAAGIVAAQHPAIIALLAAGAALFFLGRQLEKST